MKTWLCAAALAALVATPALAQESVTATTKHDHHGAEDLAQTDVQSSNLSDAHENYKAAVSQLCSAEIDIYGGDPSNGQARCESAHRAAQTQVSSQLQQWLNNPLVHATTRGAPDDAEESQVD